MASIRGMPLLRIQSSTESASAPAGLLKRLSACVAKELSKPEAYVMVSFEQRLDMLFGGDSAPACFAELMNIGSFTPQQTERLSRLLSAELTAALGVETSRIYIHFVDAQAHLWGYDGGTFA